jgi:hypothetical protein
LLELEVGKGKLTNTEAAFADLLSDLLAIRHQLFLLPPQLKPSIGQLLAMAENEQVRKQRMVTHCCAKYVQQSLQQCSPLLGRRRRPVRLSSCSASSVASLTLLIESSKQNFRVEQLLTTSCNADKPLCKRHKLGSMCVWTAIDFVRPHRYRSVPSEKVLLICPLSQN